MNQLQQFQLVDGKRCFVGITSARCCISILCFSWRFQRFGFTSWKCNIHWTASNWSNRQHSQFTIGHNGWHCSGKKGTHETVEHEQRKSVRSSNSWRNGRCTDTTPTLYKSTIFRFCWFTIDANSIESTCLRKSCDSDVIISRQHVGISKWPKITRVF